MATATATRTRKTGVEYLGDEARFDRALEILAAKLDGTKPWGYDVDPATGKVQAYLIPSSAGKSINAWMEETLDAAAEQAVSSCAA